MSTSVLNIRKIGQLSIPVHDIERAVGFYRDTLGLTLLFSLSNMAFFDCAGIRLLLSVPETQQFEHRSSIFYFDVADIHDAYETLAAKGVKMLGKPHVIAEMNGVQTWMAFFNDPDENVHALMSEIPVN